MSGSDTTTMIVTSGSVVTDDGFGPPMDTILADVELELVPAWQARESQVPAYIRGPNAALQGVVDFGVCPVILSNSAGSFDKPDLGTIQTNRRACFDGTWNLGGGTFTAIAPGRFDGLTGDGGAVGNATVANSDALTLRVPAAATPNGMALQRGLASGSPSSPFKVYTEGGSTAAPAGDGYQCLRNEAGNVKVDQILTFAGTTDCYYGTLLIGQGDGFTLAAGGAIGNQAVVVAETPVEDGGDADPGPTQRVAPRVEAGWALQGIRERLAARAGVFVGPEAIGELRGFIDEVGLSHAIGWAQDVDNSEEPVWLEVTVGGEPVVCVLANGFREDLRAAGLGSGCHAFDIAWAAAWPGDVEIRRAADRAMLHPTERALAQRAA